MELDSVHLSLNSCGPPHVYVPYKLPCIPYSFLSLFTLQRGLAFSPRAGLVTSNCLSKLTHIAYIILLVPGFLPGKVKVSERPETHINSGAKAPSSLTWSLSLQ